MARNIVVTGSRFRNGTRYNYSGPFERDGMMEYLQKYALEKLPTLTQVSAINFQEFINHDLIVLVGFLGENEGHEALRDIALQFRDQFQTGLCTDRTLMKELQVTPPTLILYHHDMGDSYRYTEALEVPRIAQFIKTNSIPIISEITPTTYELMREADLPVAFIFYSGSGERERLRKELVGVARLFRGSISFGLINGAEYQVFAGLLNIQPRFPALAIQTPANNAKYVLPQDIPVGAESVRDFAYQFLQGKAQPSLLSEDIPETNDGLVKIVVGKEFNRIVMDQEKDVVVEFYESSCGAGCNEIDPLYEAVARKFSHQKGLLFAKMDMKYNELPIDKNLEIIGFPSVKLFKAGQPKEAIDFEGAQEFNAFVDFLRQHSTYPTDVEKISDYEEYQLIMQMKQEHQKSVRQLRPSHDEL
ncbi:hypothetical protein K493DRAFT_389936 [Basidiobolus meristosporus CBS 931.73]|uniref:protein disulfide-isomerase n=1 Tax=Basidiobolus meristosporus CBS 931.73 TaxID=1314790 RepID=A0A1Y1X3Z5_9FUNG|nr:hypothetical protein K493DRAFT_389936 [Basidiobolus meristosporus CBS 931.73]|eukprot:ORX80531.1 hypothetical protein K493DRAFT_389936 [Basidiobolus meristosporus CBS 931.73]